MNPFEKCPVCGGDLENKLVEKLLRGGTNTVSMKVAAEVCTHCGERLYAEDVVKSFEEIRGKLRKQELKRQRFAAAFRAAQSDTSKSGRKFTTNDIDTIISRTRKAEKNCNGY